MIFTTQSSTKKCYPSHDLRSTFVLAILYTKDASLPFGTIPAAKDKATIVVDCAIDWPDAGVTIMRTLGLVVVLSLATVTVAVKGADRPINPHRQLVSALEENPEWQKYFASPIGSSDPQHEVEVSVPSEQNTAPPDEDDIMNGPGHAWVVAPHLQAVIQNHGGGKGSASSRNSSKSSKGKHKSKSKHSVGLEYDDDFFDYMNDAETTSDDANDVGAESSQQSYKSKSLKKKVSKASGDRESDCQFMNGIYFGKDCEESKYRRTEQEEWMPWNMRAHLLSVLFVCPAGQRSKLHKYEKYSPSPVPASDLAPARTPFPPYYPPSYVSPKPIYISPAAKPPPYGIPTVPSTPTVSTPVHNGMPTRPVYDQAPAVLATTVPVRSPVDAPVTPAATPTSEVISTLAPVPGANETETESPTSAPALGIVATSTTNYKTKTVTPKAALVRVAGTFDPDAQDETFFEVLRDNFAPYSRASIGEMLISFDLKAEFVVPDVVEVKSAVRTSWIEVVASYHVGTDDMLLFDAFTAESGYVVLTKFFQSANAQRLIQRLKEESIPIVSIEVHSTLPGNETAPTKEGGDDSDNQSVKSVSPVQEQTEGDNRSGVIAASVSGTIILVAIGAVLVKNRQSHNHAVFDDKGSVTSDYSRTDVYSGTPGGMYLPSESTSYVKPAALHLRNKKEREIGVEARISSNSTISSYQSNGTTNAERAVKKNKKNAMLQQKINYKKEKAAEAASIGQAETTLVPYADGSDCIDTAGKALKCLDGEESVGAMNETYPEFDLYHSPGMAPPSPGWSISNFSSMSRQYGVAGDDGEYSTSRKRWHDEANDLNLIALPDHSSDTGYASTNGDDKSLSSTKSKGRCSL